MELRLTRTDQNDHRTFGELWLDNEAAPFCFTLERAASDLSGHPCIPAGRYRVTLYLSPHFGREVPLLNDVPSRSMIEIHSGNGVTDSKGCILVGRNRLDDLLLNSRVALLPLIGRIKAAIAAGEAVWITVSDVALPVEPASEPLAQPD